MSREESQTQEWRTNVVQQDQRSSLYINPLEGVLHGICTLCISCNRKVQYIPMYVHTSLELLDVTVNGFSASIQWAVPRKRGSLQTLSNVQGKVCQYICTSIFVYIYTHIHLYIYKYRLKYKREKKKNGKVNYH